MDTNVIEVSEETKPIISDAKQALIDRECESTVAMMRQQCCQSLQYLFNKAWYDTTRRGIVQAARQLDLPELANQLEKQI